MCSSDLTVDADVARRKAFKVKIKSRPPLRHQFSQRELLLDALDTEVIEMHKINTSLSLQYFALTPNFYIALLIPSSYMVS